MPTEKPFDYYELLQISPNADPEMVQHAYQLLARRYGPDDHETRSSERLRLIEEAYALLSDSAARAEYDRHHREQKAHCGRLVPPDRYPETALNREHSTRLAILESLFARRRMEPKDASLFPAELKQLLDIEQQQLECTVWYLVQKRLVQRTDDSRLTITAEGVDYLDQNAGTTIQLPGRLRDARERSAGVNRRICGQNNR